MGLTIIVSLASVCGLSLGVLEPILSAPLVKALPRIIKAAKVGAKYLNEHERALTEQEIAIVEEKRAYWGGTKDWF